MRKEVKIFLILVGVAIIILGIALSNKTEYNVFYDKYDDSDYYPLEISETKMNRYNEKLNNATIGYLVSNLNIIFGENNQIDNRGIVEYAMLFAEMYDYRFEENVEVIDNVEYINIKYLNKLIKELFNVDIDISKENFNIIEEYVELNITRKVTTDVVVLNLNKVLYDEKENIYLAYISIGNPYYSENQDFTAQQSVHSNIVIRYKKNKKGLDTILGYNKVSI